MTDAVARLSRAMVNSGVGPTKKGVGHAGAAAAILAADPFLTEAIELGLEHQADPERFFLRWFLTKPITMQHDFIKHWQNEDKKRGKPQP